MTAFVRDPRKISIAHPALRVVKGDAAHQHDVIEHMQGASAVVSALNAADDRDRAVFINNILQAMHVHDLRRLVAVGGIGALQATEDRKIYELPTFPRQFVSLSQAHVRVYESLLASSSDFTYICPMFIYARKAAGRYITRKDYAVGESTVTSGDLADFIIHEISVGQFSRARVGISNN